MNSPLAVLREFFQLGLTSFGGPTAHVAFFRERFVEKKSWLSDREFADLLALCQFLPGPASSQLGLGIGWKQAGWAGAFCAWIGFTLPSALVLAAFGVLVASMGKGAIEADAGWLRGLQIAVVAVIAGAVWSMGTKLCPDRPRRLIALVAAAVMLGFGIAWMQIVIIAVGALLGWVLVKDAGATEHSDDSSASKGATGRIAAIVCLALFAVLLIGLPLLQRVWPDCMVLGAFQAMYRSGALVFGGGHVVLPLLSAEVVDPGWVSAQDFMAGYGAAQAVPGPLFTFSSYLGAVIDAPWNPWLMAGVCLIGIFLPAWLLVLGVMPFWDSVVRVPALRRALAGTNAAVVGLLGAALYSPVWTGAIASSRDVIFLLGVSAALHVLKLPAWLVVILAGGAGWLVFGVLS